jgi:hypothetical protein
LRLIEEPSHVSVEIVIAHGVIRIVKVLRRQDCLVGFASSCCYGLSLLSLGGRAASVNRKGTAVRQLDEGDDEGDASPVLPQRDRGSV